MHQLKIIQEDPYLKNYERQLINRIEWYQNTKDYIEKHFGTLYNFANAHLTFSFNYDEKNKGWWFREWLPHAHQVFLIGDFNDWNRSSHPLKRGNFGVWEIFLPDVEYKDKLVAGSEVKIHVIADNGALDRIPAYIRETSEDENHNFNGVFSGFNTFKWTDENFRKQKIETPLIYEAHIGMATEKEEVGSYRDFADKILPRIKNLGYNTVQLMAIQEHPYYGSYGYQVSNFFAPSCRFGKPDDLRYLINKAHEMGLAVILDVIHSHSVKNRNEGLIEFDGTSLYFTGHHPEWDSAIFDYAKLEVKRFLASNLRYWMEEFHFDGFRFDGVTSMLYHHHGLMDFTEYHQYFEHVNNDAVIYLQLGNDLIHEINPNIISIAEDMSGMPGICRSVKDGGLGFDYRLAMGIPDFWYNLLENKSDEQWHMGDLYWRLTNRRLNEKNIAYAESHDQAMVGDKTLAFWLMDKEMYTAMEKSQENIIIDRGIALHKMIRLITATLGGEAYLNFMGNEFGHPEWIDFPREGNNWSYHYARRQWSLAENKNLKYEFLLNFDQKLIDFIKKTALLNQKDDYKILENNENKILVFSKGSHLFAFNFGTESFSDFAIPLKEKGNYKICLSTDDEPFGGFERIDKDLVYKTQKNNDLLIYLPSRTALVFEKK